jgi:hypothetical protein
VSQRAAKSKAYLADCWRGGHRQGQGLVEGPAHEEAHGIGDGQGGEGGREGTRPGARGGLGPRATPDRDLAGLDVGAQVGVEA